MVKLKVETTFASMISDDTLRLIISLFFGLLGLLHFIFGKAMEKYAIEAELLNANVAVKMSGTLLIGSSIALHIPKYAEFGFYGLSIFLVLSSVILHKFWTKTTILDQITELLHFMKNLLLAVFIWYLKEKLE